MLWEIVLFLNYVILIIGVVMNIIFMKVVVFSTTVNLYSRISLFCISSGMMTFLVSYGLGMGVCLSSGTIFEDKKCSQQGLKFFFMYCHRFAEETHITSHFIFCIDRMISLRCSAFYESSKYPKFFAFLVLSMLTISGLFSYTMMEIDSRFFHSFWLFLSSFMMIANFLIELHGIKAAKKKYVSTIGLLPLSKRYDLSSTYEVVNSLVVTSMATILMRLLQYCYILALLIFGLSVQDDIYKVYSLMNIHTNSETIIFPCIFMYRHKYIRRKVFSYHSKPERLKGLNGQDLIQRQTQTAYFAQLKSTW